MAKNNCCRICGRLDYDDNGEYLICRACGEKKKKYRISTRHFFFIPIFGFLGIIFEIIAALIGVYKQNVYSPNFRNHPFLSSVRYKFTVFLSCIHNSYNEFDLLMIDLRRHLFWIYPLFLLIGIVFFGIAIFFIIRIYSDLKKIALLRPQKGESHGKE